LYGLPFSNLLRCLERARNPAFLFFRYCGATATRKRRSDKPHRRKCRDCCGDNEHGGLQRRQFRRKPELGARIFPCAKILSAHAAHQDPATVWKERPRQRRELGGSANGVVSRPPNTTRRPLCRTIPYISLRYIANGKPRVAPFRLTGGDR